MRAKWQLRVLCACAPALTTLPANAFELSGGVSAAGIQIGVHPMLAVSPFMGVLWRTQGEITWSAGSDVCKGTTGTCRTFYQGQHRSLDEAKATCEQIYGVGKNADVQSCGGCVWVQGAKNDCLEHCKDLCLQIWEKCRDDCPKGNINCLAECTNKLADCNRECERKCK